MDVRDVWVVERGEDVCLPLESSEALRIVREEIREDLDSDVAIQTRVTGTIDLPHPAHADEGENLVRTQPRTQTEAQGEVSLLRRSIHRPRRACTFACRLAPAGLLPTAPPLPPAPSHLNGWEEVRLSTKGALI